MPKLTNQQKAFCAEYVRSGFDQQNSAIASGYSKRNAASISSNLMKKPQVAAEIQRLCDQIEKKSIITAERLLQELSSIIDAPVNGKISTENKLRAIDLMGKYFCLWSERSVIATETIAAPVISSPQEVEALRLASNLYVKQMTGCRTIDNPGPSYAVFEPVSNAASEPIDGRAETEFETENQTRPESEAE